MKQSQQITPTGTKTTIIDVWKWGKELERLRARVSLISIPGQFSQRVRTIAETYKGQEM